MEINFSEKEEMAINLCRVCGNNFFQKPLLIYNNMPSAAQYFPDKKSINQDKGVDLIVCQCSSCGLVQLKNSPVSYYREVIRAAGFSKEMKQFRKKQFEKIIKDFNLNNKKIIEVGCGHGEYLSIMKELEINTFGIEKSKEAVKNCISKELNVSTGYIEEESYKIDNAPFDFFFILSFLEHLPNINVVLRGIYNNMQNNGIGLIEVPNFNMILQKNLFSEFIRDHLFYFTSETLKSTLMINGFEVVSCQVIWYDYIISVIVKKIEKIQLNHFNQFQDKIKNNVEKIQLNHFNQFQDKIKNDIEDYIKDFKKKRVAIWGAGHQALTLISLLNLQDKISYVIDSAHFKQNRYTPVTHIPIVSPEKIISDPIEAVIIIAASYSDEVAKILLENYKNDCSISILRQNKLEIIRK